jgi:hypothetical protein
LLKLTQQYFNDMEFGIELVHFRHLLHVGIFVDPSVVIYCLHESAHSPICNYDWCRLD